MSINACACMGPMYGDPYCICEMQNRGLIPSKGYDITPEKEKALELALSKMFKWKQENGRK